MRGNLCMFAVWVELDMFVWAYDTYLLIVMLFQDELIWHRIATITPTVVIKLIVLT